MESSLTHRFVDVNGVRLHLAEQGQRPLPLRGPVILPGCGHWTQQERPAEVNAALLGVLADIDGSPR